MNERLRNFLASLRDPDQYIREPGVYVFDEHTERYWVDDRGRPVPEGSPRAKKEVVRHFDKAALEKLAAINNRHTHNGDLTSLVLGHTDPKQRDETKQPRPRGYALGYRVVYDKPRGKWMLATDYYIRRDEHAKAQTFPYTSIELWPKQGRIHPISLLRRTPARDLGQWTYGMGGEVLRYSMESSMARRYEQPEDDDLFGDDTPETPAGDADDPLADDHGDDGDLNDDEIEEYNRHCYSHPHAERYSATMRRRYGMDAGVPPGEPPAPGADPAAMPSADATPPGAPPGPPMQNRRGGKPSQFSRQAEGVRRAAEQASAAKLREELATSKAQNRVLALTAEGYHLDADVEVRRFARMGEAEADSHEQYIRRHHVRAPMSYGRPVSPGPISAPSGDDSTPDNDDHEALAFQYLRENAGASWDKCVRETRRK